MRQFRTYSALFLMVLFCCYYSSISMFSHVHIANSSSIVHSHLGGGTDHQHSESQYAIIDILSQFQSESAFGFYSVGLPFSQLSELYAVYSVPFYPHEFYPAYSLRGPPQA